MRNAYYIGCFAQVEKPKEFYDKILARIDSKPQTGEEIFSFLKNMTIGSSKGSALDSAFNIPLKLTPEFDVGIFNYIYRMEEDTVQLYLPDVALSLNGSVLKPDNDMYKIKPGLVKIKYNGQVYTIIAIRAGT